jgi:FlaA1/EpsC-like NDP-sugar epimerase
MTNSVFSKRLSRRAAIALVVHTVTFAIAYWLAFAVRFDFALPQLQWQGFFVTLTGVLCIKLMVFYAGGHCHRSWHYVSFSDLAALLRAATISSLIIVTLDRLMAASYHIPRAVFGLDWALTIVLLGGLRALARLVREEVRPRLYGSGYRKALIIGANQSGETLARHLLSDPKLKYSVAGFLDPQSTRYGSTISGIPVLGHPEATLKYAAALSVEQIMIIAGVLTGSDLRVLMDSCAKAGLSLKVIPAVEDLLSSDYSVQMRDVDINDLLRREPVQLNNDAISTLIADRTILVTGAGGSIGSEICRQVLKYHPRRLLLVERGENALFVVEQEFYQLRLETEIIPCIGDVGDHDRMEHLFEQYRPDVVFHAAAHKHVPMMEFNPGEAIKNNVLGTRLLVELADEYGVHEFVMISTDKAVNPTSVMGVSKQLAERFVHAFSEAATTKFVVVRFGNVLASNGSVVPIFQEQIRRGGPITVTHPEIERFFMTIPEASQLVLQAATMGKGGEIFVLDMGLPVRIVDLARDLVRLSGIRQEDIEIIFTGLRPGEKLYEELYFEDEEMQATPHSKVFVAYHRPYSLAEVRQAIDELAKHLHASPDTLRRKIKMLVPEYTTSGLIVRSPDESAHPTSDLPQRQTHRASEAV